MYVSLHKFNNGNFFPGQSGSYKNIGTGNGIGYNVNIGWDDNYPDIFGDLEYIYAFQQVVIPMLKEFQPEILVISSGFDSCLGDPLGNLHLTL